MLLSRELPDTPFYIEKLQELMPHAESKTDSTPSEGHLLRSSPATYVPKGTTPSDTGFDQLLGGYLDVSTLEWGIYSACHCR